MTKHRSDGKTALGPDGPMRMRMASVVLLLLVCVAVTVAVIATVG